MFLRLQFTVALALCLEMASFPAHALGSGRILSAFAHTT